MVHMVAYSLGVVQGSLTRCDVHMGRAVLRCAIFNGEPCIVDIK